MEVTTEVYALAHKLPTNERHGLKSQLCRSAVSVPANIADGAGRSTPEEFDRCLGVAAGSLYELETHLLISLNLSFFNKDETSPLLQKIERLHDMLSAFKNKLGIHIF